jgi:hypothetical protein
MLGFFLMLLVIGVILYFIAPKPVDPGKPDSYSGRPCDENPDDRKHRWVLRFEKGDRRGYLICKVCGKIPGEDN